MVTKRLCFLVGLHLVVVTILTKISWCRKLDTHCATWDRNVWLSASLRHTRYKMMCSMPLVASLSFVALLTRSGFRYYIQYKTWNSVIRRLRPDYPFTEEPTCTTLPIFVDQSETTAGVR